jgi:hypothetical protein
VIEEEPVPAGVDFERFTFNAQDPPEGITEFTAQELPSNVTTVLLTVSVFSVVPTVDVLDIAIFWK